MMVDISHVGEQMSVIYHLKPIIASSQFSLCALSAPNNPKDEQTKPLLNGGALSSNFNWISDPTMEEREAMLIKAHGRGRSTMVVLKTARCFFDNLQKQYDIEIGPSSLF
jgi:hypothetical protein